MGASVYGEDMSRVKNIHRCRECGWTSPKWVGQCRQCRMWDCLEEAPTVLASSASSPALSSHTPARPALPIADVEASRARALPTGQGEVDRVLGGGIIRGSVILLAGEPGVGKSTLLLDLGARLAAYARTEDLGPVLYVTGEESAAQVRLRAERTAAMDPHLFLCDESDLATLLGHVEQTRPSLLIVDSVQTIHAANVEGSPGGPTQVRAVSQALIRTAKTLDLPVLLVGHVTKDGGVAGPRLLEHLVDVVCQFEGDRHSPLRLLRAVKNRYGPTDEVGCFEMDENGIHGLPDPSGLFLSSQGNNVIGSCPTISIEGRRPIPTEIQALLAPSGSSPRRATSGVDTRRVAMVLAVLQSRHEVPSHQLDAYVSTVGGARTSEPASDLAIALALYSSHEGRPLSGDTIAVGEVGLTGEIRSCPALPQRLREASRLGFTRALIPASTRTDLVSTLGLDIVPVPDLFTAFSLALT